MKFSLKKFLTASVSMLIVFSMFSGLLVFAAEDAAKEEYWDSDYRHETNIMQFHPSDGYVSEQNPPNFTWGYVDGATYEIAVASDPEMKDIKYSKDGITLNYYNFDTTFETGVHYYWAVRYKLAGNVSTWSTPRRFRISPDAYEFVLPPMDEIMARVPTSHPRIYTNPDDYQEFLSLKDKSAASKETYDYFMERARVLTDARFIQEEPEYQTFPSVQAQSEWHSANASKMNTNTDNALTCGFAYLLSGNKEFADYAIECLMAAASWDYKEGPTSYKKQDQWHRSITYKSAMAYDWLYPEMTEEERATVLEMVRARALDMAYLLDTLGTSPYDSHGWTAYGYMGIVAIATYGEIPEAEEWLEKVILGYSAILPPWSYQDGGWSQGTDYWQYSTNASHEFLRCLASAGILNLYEQAWQQNQYLFSLYAFPPGSYGTFGDASFLVLSQNIYSAETLAHDAYFTKNPVTKWLLEKFGGYKHTNNFSYVTNSMDFESKEPKTYQLSHEFNDIGWVIMMDDLLNQDRIQFSFKSSFYGSFNHSHADQNSFVLQAYGQKLAIKAGYYDAYHTPHDSGFTRTTPAHNSVTVATSKGQKDDDFSAKGHLTGYLTQVDFDLAKGDATEAYKGVLGKFERSVIYVRPDMFIIVDDLKAPEAGPVQFEWWLNAEHDMEVYEDNTGARITEGDAVLDTKVVYPEKVTPYYNNTFASSNMKEYLPEGSYATRTVHRRVWFETEKTEATKMIVALDVHKANEEARYIDYKYFDNYVKMTLEDGTVIYVNLGESNEEVVTEDGITFTGECVVYNDRSIMLSGGTSVKQGEKELISLAHKGSVVMGDNEISISTYEDNYITVNTDNDYMSKIESVTNYEGTPISRAYGITMEDGKLVKTVDEETGEVTDVKIEPAENYVTFDAEMDNYQLMLNGKLISDSEVSTTATVSIDGVEEEVTLNGYINRAGEAVYTGEYDFGSQKLTCTELSDGLSVSGLYPGVTKGVAKATFTTQKAEGNYIKLNTVPTVEVNTTTNADYDAVKDTLAVFKEAEHFSGDIAAGAAPYSTRSFLSNGTAVQLFNTPGTSMSYEIEIPEEGDYDFVVKYVAWEDGGAVRSFAIDGKDYKYTLEKTVDWGTLPENWVAACTDSGIHLKPGKYTLTMDVVSGVWNYDWFGFVKR